jgi:hypothetical protein
VNCVFRNEHFESRLKAGFGAKNADIREFEKSILLSNRVLIGQAL